MTSNKEKQVLKSSAKLDFHETKAALDLHRRFLQDVLADVMPILSTGERSPERLIKALTAYWEACFARRAQRKKILTLALEAQISPLIEPLGRPFFHMVLSELWTIDDSVRNTLASTVYNDARAVAVSEANLDKRLPALREKVTQMITTGSVLAA